jgi:hypothetical protein
LFVLSFGIIVFALILGGILNPPAVVTALREMPYIAAGVVVFVLVALGVLVYSARGFRADSKKEPLPQKNKIAENSGPSQKEGNIPSISLLLCVFWARMWSSSLGY